MSWFPAKVPLLSLVHTFPIRLISGLWECCSRSLVSCFINSKSSFGVCLLSMFQLVKLNNLLLAGCFSTTGSNLAPGHDAATSTCMSEYLPVSHGTDQRHHVHLMMLRVSFIRLVLNFTSV